MGRRGLCTLALVAALTVAMAAPAGALTINLRIGVTPATPPVVYAHRGGAGLAPENTLGAFRQAQSQFGARGVWLEMDTQLTADGQLVIMHDDTLDRTTTCSGTVISHTLASLAGCDASKSFPGWHLGFEPIPTMQQVLTEGRDHGWRLFVEIKDIPGEANFDALGQNAANVLIPLIDSIGFPHDRIAIQSFWPFALDRVKQLAPDIATCFLTSSTLPSAPKGVGIPVTFNALYSLLRGYTITAPADDTADLNATTVSLAHTLGRRVVVWTPDTPDAIARDLGYTVDGVISNRPDLVYAAL